MPSQKDKYPMVKYLMECYFHQMWIDLNTSQGLGNPRDFHHPLNEFLELEKVEVVSNTIENLNTLLKDNLTEDDLENLIRKEYYAAVKAPFWGLTYAGWLKQVRDYLKAGLKNK